MKNHNTILAWVTSTLVLAVATISFILSYHALQGVASANGLTGWLSYIWPLLVDFSLVVFSLCVVSAHLYSESTWKQWSLVSISTALTVFYNALYAYPDMVLPLAQKLLVIGLPPIMLFFSFELLMSQLKNGIKRNQQQATIAGYDTALQTAQRGFDELMAQVETIKAQHIADIGQRDKALEIIAIEHSNELAELQRALEVASDPVSHRRERVLSLVQTYRAEFGEEPTQVYLSEQTGVSVQTIRGDLKALNGKAALPAGAVNGHGGER